MKKYCLQAFFQFNSNKAASWHTERENVSKTLKLKSQFFLSYRTLGPVKWIFGTLQNVDLQGFFSFNFGGIPLIPNMLPR